MFGGGASLTPDIPLPVAAATSPPFYNGRVSVADPALLERLRDRDPQALGAVVDDHARPLYRAACGLGFAASEAEDLVQDVFVTFLESLDRFEGRSALRTWLFGILHRKTLERRRAGRRDEQADAIDEVFESRFDLDGHWSRPPLPVDRLAEARETDDALRACLDGLPDLQRGAFHLREVEGLPAPEAAAALGCTVNHVGVLFHRARLRLRECLEAKGWGRTR